MKAISLKTLKRLDACSAQVAKFSELFGNSSITPTRELCLKHASVFDWGWAAGHLLTAPAWKAYDEATATAWKAYDEAKAPAWKAYDEAKAPAWKAYDEAKATAFADAFTNQ